MLRFTSATSLSPELGTSLWNEGFHGYPLTMTIDSNRFVKRFAEENLSPTLSIIAWEGDRSVGFVYNGTYIRQGESIAWNGGTGVIPEYRGKRVGHALMDKTLHTYEKAGIKRAFLEVLAQNEPAIRLYQSLGYKETGRLHMLRHTDSTRLTSRTTGDSLRLTPRRDIGSLPFYQHDAPWQCQWMNGVHTEGWIVEEEDGQVAGYALYRTTLDEKGQLTSMSLLQAAARPNHPDPERILLSSLHPLLQPGKFTRMATNIPADSPLLPLLEKLGFQRWIEQLAMERIICSS